MTCLRILRWLFPRRRVHSHRWETVREVMLKDTFTGETGTRFLLRCKDCGDVVKRDLI
jgi:hypothetical protein